MIYVTLVLFVGWLVTLFGYVDVPVRLVGYTHRGWLRFWLVLVTALVTFLVAFTFLFVVGYVFDFTLLRSLLQLLTVTFVYTFTFYTLVGYVCSRLRLRLHFTLPTHVLRLRLRTLSSLVGCRFTPFLRLHFLIGWLRLRSVTFVTLVLGWFTFCVTLRFIWLRLVSFGYVLHVRLVYRVFAFTHLRWLRLHGWLFTVVALVVRVYTLLRLITFTVTQFLHGYVYLCLYPFARLPSYVIFTFCVLLLPCCYVYPFICARLRLLTPRFPFTHVALLQLPRFITLLPLHLLRLRCFTFLPCLTTGWFTFTFYPTPRLFTFWFS